MWTGSRGKYAVNCGTGGNFTREGRQLKKRKEPVKRAQRGKQVSQEEEHLHESAGPNPFD